MTAPTTNWDIMLNAMKEVTEKFNFFAKAYSDLHNDVILNRKKEIQEFRDMAVIHFKRMEELVTKSFVERMKENLDNMLKEHIVSDAIQKELHELNEKVEVWGLNIRKFIKEFNLGIVTIKIAHADKESSELVVPKKRGRPKK